MRQRGVAKTPRLGRIVAYFAAHYDLTSRLLLSGRAMLRIMPHRSMLRIAFHGTMSPPVTVSTTIVPVICGCREQKYS